MARQNCRLAKRNTSCYGRPDESIKVNEDANTSKDQERKEAIALLQAAITEGVESGEPQLFDPAAFKLRMRERHVVR
jgi:hypothetical protein